MKYTRSVKCYYSRWLTESKKTALLEFIGEMHRVVEWCINKHQYRIIAGMKKFDLLSSNNISECDSWLTYRAKSNAFAEAYSLVIVTKNSANALEKPYKTPVHNQSRILLSCNNATIQMNPELNQFDLLVDIRYFDSRKKATISIPLKKHEVFNKWNGKGNICSSILLTDKYVQFSFEMEQSKKTEGNIMGIDPGAVHVINDDEGNHYGSNMMPLLQKLKRKKKRSKAWWACREEILEYIDHSCKQIPFHSLKLLVLENNKRIKHKSKLKGRLSRNMRSVLTGWSVNRIDNRNQMLTEENGVSLRRVPAFNNSITCPDCSHSEKANRATQEDFICKKCGASYNADMVGAMNSLARFALGTYGSEYKQHFMDKHPNYHQNDNRVVLSTLC